MPNINLPTGKTIYVSTYEFYFLLQDEDVDLFYQSCMADDLGTFVDNAFSNRTVEGRLEVLEIDDVEVEEL